jgi:hypothetical protein
VGRQELAATFGAVRCEYFHPSPVYRETYPFGVIPPGRDPRPRPRDFAVTAENRVLLRWVSRRESARASA